MPLSSQSNRFLPLKNLSIPILNENNSNETNLDGEDIYSDDVNITIFGLVFVSIGFVGIVGNLMVVTAVLTDKKMRRSAMNILLVNLAIADLGNLVVCTPDIVQKLSQTPEWLLPDLFCPTVRYLQIIFLYTSLLTQVAVSIERYFAIAWPMRVRVLCTRRKLLLWTSTLWITGSLSASPYLMFSYISIENLVVDNHQTYSNRTFSFGKLSYSKLTLTRVCSWRSTEQFDLFFKCAECLIYYFIPLIIIITLYTKISYILWNKRKSPFCRDGSSDFRSSSRRDGSFESAIYRPPDKEAKTMATVVNDTCWTDRRLFLKMKLVNQQRQKQNSQRNQSKRESNQASTTSRSHNYADMLKSRQNVIKMLAACGFVYFLGYSPVQIIFLSEILFNSDTRFSLTIRLLLNCLAYTCSATNPLLYSIFSRKFRERFVGIARCGNSDDEGLALTAKYRRPSLLVVRPMKKSSLESSSPSLTIGDGERDENEYDRPPMSKKKSSTTPGTPIDFKGKNYSIFDESPKFGAKTKDLSPKLRWKDSKFDS